MKKPKIVPRPGQKITIRVYDDPNQGRKIVQVIKRENKATSKEGPYMNCIDPYSRLVHSSSGKSKGTILSARISRS